MKQILIIFGLLISVTTFAQSPRIKLNQITKDNASGSVLISSPSDSGMVYSRDFYISYGVDTVLIFNGDTIRSVVAASVLSDGVTITGDGTTGNELKVDTSLVATIKALNDTLIARGYLTTEVDGSVTNEGSLTVVAGGANDSQIQSNTSGSTNVTIAGGSNVTVTESGNTITIASTAAGAIPVDTFVTIAGTETITGAKTFTSDLNVDAKIALNAGDNNIVIGDGAGLSLVSGQAIRNVLVGTEAGAVISKADYNIAIGYRALYSDTTGSNNIAIGNDALRLNTTGNSNMANGYSALRSNTTGIQNIANGYNALYSNTTGSNNIGNGYEALYLNLSGATNIANGFKALYSNISGGFNIANGSTSLYSLSSGSNNQAYGYNSGRYLSDGSALTTANGSLFIGSNTRASANGNTNEIVIGTSAIGNGSNTITIGSSSAVSLHTRNYEFDIDQTVSASEDNYVLTYDSLDGQISLEPIALSGSATLDFGSTSSLNSSDLTITVTGAADGDVVSLGVPNASVNANTNYTAWVSAANTVTVRFNNYSLGAVDPASGTFKVKVFK